MGSDPRLFDLPPVASGTSAPPLAVSDDGARRVRVLPDVAGLDKMFDYTVPKKWADDVDIGTLVLVTLVSRRVEAWIIELDVEAQQDYPLRSIERVLSHGPPAEVVDLARWAAFRWAGRHRSTLRSASPTKRVSHWPKEFSATPSQKRPPASSNADFVQRVLAGPRSVGVVCGAAQSTLELLSPLLTPDSLVVVPTVARARFLAGQLSRSGFDTHLYSRDWSAGMRGGVTVGQRSSVWAPLAARVDTFIVIDEHDEGLQEERNPTWHAREVIMERARRRDARCILMSPCLSLAARSAVESVFELPREMQRSSWPVVDVVDRRSEEPNRYGLFSPAAVDALRNASSGLAILNRKGRSVMLACQTCGELVRTLDGERLMSEVNGGLLCSASGETRPKVCALCGGTTLRRLRLGIGRAAEELSALMGEPVAELSGGNKEVEPTRISLGTEAALYQVQSAEVVVFLDFDQELLAQRYRAGEQATALLVRAARLIGGRKAKPNGRLIVQTRTPEHRVLLSTVRSDTSRLVGPERELRSALGLPPFGALAELSHEAADELAASIRATLSAEPGRWPNVVVMGPRSDQKYLVRADDAEQLASVLAEAPRPPGRVRVSVDPPSA